MLKSPHWSNVTASLLVSRHSSNRMNRQLNQEDFNLTIRGSAVHYLPIFYTLVHNFHCTDVEPHSVHTGAVYTTFGCSRTCVAKQTTVWSMQSERALSTIPHCLEWYKLVLCTCLPTPAVH